jgi:hypothetical protein
MRLCPAHSVWQHRTGSLAWVCLVGINQAYSCTLGHTGAFVCFLSAS